jgi:uncharacterized protein YfaS (alpha-2-macroglobulin family)
MRVPSFLVTLVVSLGLLFPAVAADKSVQLILSTPQLEPTTTFEFRFPEPMVDGGSVGQSAEPPPIVVTPPVKGRFTWLSPRSGVFTPEEAFALGTTYRLALREGLKNAGGLAFGGALDTTVATPRFGVKGFAPVGYVNAADASAQPAFNLLFNADVRAADVASAFRFVNKAGVTVPARVVQAMALFHPEHRMPAQRSDDRSLLTWAARFEASRQPPAPGVTPPEDVSRDNQLFVTPERALPAGEDWRLVAQAGLKSSDGAMQLAEPYTIAIGTVRPFTVEGVEALNDLEAGRRLFVTFSKRLGEEVKPETVARWVRVKPEPKNLKATIDGAAVTLGGEFSLGRDYEVSIAAGLRAAEPFGLAKAHREKLAFDPVEPVLALEGFAAQQLSTGTRQFHLQAVNVPRVRVTARLVEAAALPQAITAYDEYLNPPDVKEDEYHRRIDPAKIPGREIFRKDLAGTEQVDTARTLALAWDEILGPGKTGVVLVTAEQLGKPATPGRRPGVQAIVQVTDLGVVWKISRRETFAHTFSLASGGALGGVRLTLLDAEHQKLGEATTDDTGLAKLPVAIDARWLLAQRGADQNLIPLHEHDGRISLWRFRIPRHEYDDEEEGGKGAGAGDGRHVFLFTERAVYKPGETVYCKGIVRDLREGQPRIPASVKCELRGLDARDREFFRREITLSALGSLSDEIPLPVGVLGEYRLTLRLVGDAADAPLAEHYFQVQHYVPNAFEIAIGGPRRFTGVQPLSIPITAQYYMGRRLSKAQLAWSLDASDEGFSPEGLDDFDFCHAVDDYRLNRELDRLAHFSRQGKLDLGADGTALVDVEIPLNAKAPQPREARLLCEITDLNQQTVSQSATLTLHPSDFYLGIGTLPDVVHTGQPVPVSLVAVRNDGTPETASKPAKLRVTRIEWQNTRVETAGYGSEYRSEPRFTVVSEQEVTTQPLAHREHKWMVADETARVPLVAGAPGLYLLEASAKDAAGRDVLTTTTFYVSGDAVAEWDYRNEFQIDLVPDKLAYDAGETARILIKTPIAGEALVTLEREGVLRSFTTKLAGNAPTIEVPLQSADAPNVFVSVMLLRGAADSPRKFKAPEYRVGYCHLKVTRPESKLSVKVAPAAAKVQPGEPVTLTAEVLSFQGQPRAEAEVTLFAVDEGVLSLAGYETPDPLAFFHRAIPLGVTTALTIPTLLNEDPAHRDFVNKGYVIGGGGEDFGDRMRKNFITCAYWNANLRTDAAGRVTATFPAPDSLTRYRIVAVVQTAADEFGSAESAFEIAKPVMLEPALPRFANIGDRLALRGVLHNQTDFSGEVEVRLELDATATAENPTRRLPLAARASVAVDFPVEFRSAGTAKWKWTARFLADDGRTAFRDAVETTLKVGHPVPSLREVHLGRTEAAESELLARVNPALLDGEGVVRVSVSNSRILEMAESIEQLLHYPYGCVEQTTSSLLPWLTLRDFRDALPELRKTDSEIRAVVNRGIDRILGMQTASGGLAYWPGGREPMLWGSAYGGLGLALAKRAGFDVPAESFDRLAKYVSAQLRGLGENADKLDHYGLNERCLALYMLAVAGRAEPAYHELLFVRRAALTSENRATLALAILESGGARPMVAELLDPKLGELKHDDGMFWSASRGDALRLLAWSRHQPDAPQIDTLVADLFGGRTAGHWRTTQGNAWSLLALSEYLRRVETGDKTIAGTVAWAGQSSAFQLAKAAPLHLATFPLTAETGAQPMKIANPEQKRVFTEVEIESRPRVIQQPRQDRGYQLARSYARVEEDNTLAEFRDAKVGDRVLVTLTLTARETARFVAIEDPLPSVLEAVNPAFKTQETRAAGALSRDWVSDHQELRDDRALFFCDQLFPGTYTIRYLARVRAAGTATAPSAKVEEMYHPERFGMTETQLVSATALK